MKLTKLLPIMAIAGVCFAGQANAAQDQLMMPEQASAPMTVNEQEVSLAVPSEEVKAVAKHITLHHTKDGVAAFLKQLIINNNN